MKVILAVSSCKNPVLFVVATIQDKIPLSILYTHFMPNCVSTVYIGKIIRFFCVIMWIKRSLDWQKGIVKGGLLRGLYCSYHAGVTTVNLNIASQQNALSVLTVVWGENGNNKNWFFRK